MSIIRTLTKKGTIIEYKALEGVRDIFLQMNGFQTEELLEDGCRTNRDFILLTSDNGTLLIINKRFIHAVIDERS